MTFVFVRAVPVAIIDKIRRNCLYPAELGRTLVQKTQATSMYNVQYSPAAVLPPVALYSQLRHFGFGSKKHKDSVGRTMS